MAELGCLGTAVERAMAFGKRPLVALLDVRVSDFDPVPSGVHLLVNAAFREGGRRFAGRVAVGHEHRSNALHALEGRPLFLLVKSVAHMERFGPVLVGDAGFLDEASPSSVAEAARLAKELNTGTLYAELMSDVDLSTLNDRM